MNYNPALSGSGSTSQAVIPSNPPSNPWDPSGSGQQWDATNFLLFKKVAEPDGTHSVWEIDCAALTITNDTAGENIQVIDALSAVTATITSGNSVVDGLMAAFGTVEGEATLVYRNGDSFYVRQKTASPAQTFPVIASTGEELDHLHGVTSLADATPGAAVDAGQWVFDGQSTH